MSVYNISEFKVLARRELYRENPKKSLNKKYIIIGTIAGTIAVGSTYSFLNYQTNSITLYHVYLDGEKIGTVNNKAIIDIWKSQELRKAQSKYGLINLDLRNTVTYQIERKYKGEYDNLKAITNLKGKFEIEAIGAKVVINGEVIGVVNDKATLEKILENIKQAYITKEEKESKVYAASLKNPSNNNIMLENVGFKENITIEEIKVSPNKIDNEETVLKIITPLLTIQTEETITQLEEIPYKVVYKFDESMYINETKVLIAGIEGKKEVQYAITKENGAVVEKRVANVKVMNQAINQEMLKGTKAIPSKGSGVLAWPTFGGIITSDYGPRWDSFHFGLDISGVKDETIKAADNGKIIFTGVKSGYGKTVMIDHDNGIVTLYAHLNIISVALGDTIAKEQKIGVMGSTGRSTGKHLHFEVKVNDEPKNPLNYIGN